MQNLLEKNELMLVPFSYDLMEELQTKSLAEYIIVSNISVKSEENACTVICRVYTPIQHTFPKCK